MAGTHGGAAWPQVFPARACFDKARKNSHSRAHETERKEKRQMTEEEYKQLMETIAHLRAILESEKLVYDIIKEESLQMIEK